MAEDFAQKPMAEILQDSLLRQYAAHFAEIIPEITEEDKAQLITSYVAYKAAQQRFNYFSDIGNEIVNAHRDPRLRLPAGEQPSGGNPPDTVHYVDGFTSETRIDNTRFLGEQGLILQAVDELMSQFDANIEIIYQKYIDPHPNWILQGNAVIAPPSLH